MNRKKITLKGLTFATIPRMNEFIGFIRIMLIEYTK